MKPAQTAFALASFFSAVLLLPSLPPLTAAEPFDYFQNSWSVIGLKDYKDGTRVTPQNELLLAGDRKLRLAIGPRAAALSRKQTKTLLEGWMPVIQLHAEEAGVRYEFTLWATPMPNVKDWSAAFGWPTEGENYLNWIRVSAVNGGSSAALAQVKAELLGKTNTTLADWRPSLAPGERAETVLRVPFLPVSDASGFEQANARLWLDRTTQYWRGALAGGARIEVPCEKSTQTLRAAHVCQLIANDHGVMHAGEGFYDEFYIRDGGYQLLEFEEAGLWDVARKAVEAYLPTQRPDGRFETQADQYDANGQALWVLWQYGKITRDAAWLRKVYPQIRRSVAWIQKARRLAPADSPFAGLLPPAPADGEFLWDGKHHIVGYDFWNLRGLLCAADAALDLGETADAQAFTAEAAEYRQAIDAAWKRTGQPHFPPSWEKDGTHWGDTETLWPTELFAPGDPRVTASLAEARERHGGGFVEGTLRWTGQPNAIHPYLSSYTTLASLIRGDHDKFVEEFYWYLLHSTASHAFPEGIFFKRRYAWSETTPHALGAANFAILLRHALIHEQGNVLHLLPGVPDGWLEKDKVILVENAPTLFGPLTLQVRGTGQGVEVQFEGPRRNPPQSILLHLPRSRPPAALPAHVTLAMREAQARPWDFATVVELYRSLPVAQAKPITGLVPLPLGAALDPARCQLLDVSKLANTDPFNAPFGVVRPGKFLFTGLQTGVQTVAGVPFRLLDPAQNQGRGLVVLQGAGACASFPSRVEIPVGAQGTRLFLLGNVHGWSPDDDGAGEWGAVAEYVIHYADGQTQTVPLISLRTIDDWAGTPEATETFVGLKGEPWHLNMLAVSLRPVRIEKIVFRDLGTPAAPVLAAVTLEN